MSDASRPGDPGSARHDRSPGGGHASDEATADEARRRLRDQGIVPIEPDERVGGLLATGEQVLAVRRSVYIDRRQPRRDDSPGLRGDLYLTTRRLVHLGRETVEYRLDEVREADVVAGELRLVIGDNRGVAIDVADPRLLRVEIAAARAAARIGESI